MDDKTKQDSIEKARKAMTRALKKYGATSPQFAKARNLYNSLMGD